LEEDPLADVRTSYIEVSRQYRRTRYTHDDWLKHRSPDRFLSNLAQISTSGIYRGISKEVATVTSIATLVWAWNLFLGEGWTDLSGIHHDPGEDDGVISELTITYFGSMVLMWTRRHYEVAPS